MKRTNKKFLILLTSLAVVVVLFACSKSFLDKPPIGSYDPETLANKAGVEGILVGAYSMLDGQGGAGGSYPTAEDNWVWGGVCADEAHKGSDPGDQPDIVALMTWDESSTNSYTIAKWATEYDGIQRANDVLRTMRLATDMTSADTTECAAEARFLRGFYHFELKKIFNQIPFVDESISYSNGNWRVSNTVPGVWAKIEGDFQYAQANLPAAQTDVGRANKYAAEAFLAKAYMYDGAPSAPNLAGALPLLNDLIQNGVNTVGLPYALLPNFSDNFNPAKNHTSDPEQVFACEMSVNDGSGAANANAGDVLNFPYASSGDPGTCCGFDQPSYSLADSYQVDSETGLPDATQYDYTSASYISQADLKNDEGLADSDPYTPSTAALDPRIDWTIGRRGVPFLDWGLMPGSSWVRNQASAGPYEPIKNSYYQSQAGTYTDVSSWTSGYTANNYNFIRFSDILLWAAECEAQIGSLDNAEKYVNMVRGRMQNPAGWVQAIAGGQSYPVTYNGKTYNVAANYMINQYPTGYFTSQGAATALKLIQHERRLEFAMEGHRFFDLVRWGIAATVLNNYVAHETKVSGYVLMNGAVFTAGKAEYFAIPYSEIEASFVGGKPTLTQNPGYN